MRNLHQSHLVVKSRTIAQTRQREQVTPMTVGRLAFFLHTQPWHTADAPSDMFERRYRLNGDLSGYQQVYIAGVQHIDLDGDVRIEFELSGATITV